VILPSRQYLTVTVVPTSDHESNTNNQTSSENILYRRAVRLRKLTGNDKIKSQGEIDSQHMSSKDIVQMTLLRPLTMTFTEPIVLAIDLYIGLIYAILYSYFESFPIVYLEGYMFPTANSNLPFLALLVGSIISYIGYCLWNKYVLSTLTCSVNLADM